MPTRSKFHHVVPKAVLRHFCYTGSKIWYYSKNRTAEGVCSRDIEKKFGRRHFYSVETKSGEKSDAFEREFLQVLDSRYAELTREVIKVIETGKYPHFDDSTQRFFLQFFYYYTKRSYDFTSKLNIYADAPELVTGAIEDYERKHGPVSDSKKSELTSDENVSSMIEYARVIALTMQSNDVAERLSRMKRVFAIPPANKQFIIGSNPVLRFENQKGAKLGDGNVELWTPMTPDLAVGMLGPIDFENRIIQFGNEFVRKFNLHMYNSSTEIGSRNLKLLKSIVESN